jgi:hypothetical protein
VLLNTTAKVLLSGYDNPEYQRLVGGGWNKISFDVNTITSERIPKIKTEFLWRNF